jgi:hypothetical protein
MRVEVEEELEELEQHSNSADRNTPKTLRVRQGKTERGLGGYLHINSDRRGAFVFDGCSHTQRNGRCNGRYCESSFEGNPLAIRPQRRLAAGCTTEG